MASNASKTIIVIFAALLSIVAANALDGPIQSAPTAVGGWMDTVADHSYPIRSNITSDQPGWDPSWHHGSRDESSAVTARAVGNGVSTHIVNNCPITIYVHSSRGSNDGDMGADDPADPTATYPISPGTDFQSSMQAVINGAGGVAIKLSNNPVIDANNIYQIEFSQNSNNEGTMALWYDLSSLNGDPFLGNPRYLQISQNGNGCPYLYSAAGATNADWPTMQTCTSVDALWFWLC